MTTPDEVIASLKDVIDAQYGVNVELREQLQTALADVEHWRDQAEAFEALLEQDLGNPERLDQFTASPAEQKTKKTGKQSLPSSF